MDRRQFIATGTAAATVALLPEGIAAQSRPAPGDAALDALFDRIFKERVLASPESATQFGLDKGANAGLKRRWSDASPAGKARDLAATKSAIARITAITPATLSPAARLNREVVLYSLNDDTVAQDRFGLDSVNRPFTIFQQGGVYFSAPDFLNSAHTITSIEDAEAYLARLDGMAAVLDEDTAEQKRQAARGYVAPGWSLTLTLDQLAKLRAPAPEANPLTISLATRAAAAKVPGDWSARATRLVRGSVYPALDRQIALIRTLAARPSTTDGIWALPQGEAIYASALRQSTTTEMSADEIHQLGIAQVAEISAQLDTILRAQGLTTGSVGARLNQLNTRPDQVYPDTPAGRADLIRSLNQGNAAMQAKLARVFRNPPNAPLDIRAVPTEIQDGASNGYYRLAALDGSRPAIYFINLKSVGDWPRYSLPSLTYHEGVPGHHLQLTLAQNAPGPMLRKLSFFGAYIEGWALYAESVADEQGGYTPLERAGFLQSYLFRAARLVIDTGLHAKRWSREKATDYMVETVGFARPRSQREIERYCTQPGQATSYKVGHAAWVRARANAKRIAGNRFDLKQFHDVLREGAMPLSILERLVEERARQMV